VDEAKRVKFLVAAFLLSFVVLGFLAVLEGNVVAAMLCGVIAISYPVLSLWKNYDHR